MKPFEFNDDADVVVSDDPFYDLFDGGYIKPSEMLPDPKQIEQVELAMGVIQRFLDQAEEHGALEFS